MNKKKYVVLLLCFTCISFKNNIYSKNIENHTQNIVEGSDFNKYESDIYLLKKKTKEISVEKLQKIYKELAEKYREKEYYNISLLHCDEIKKDSADMYLDKMFVISKKNDLKKIIQISPQEKSNSFLKYKNIDSADHYLKLSQELLEDKNINDHNKLIDEFKKIEDLINLNTKVERNKYISIIAILFIITIIFLYISTFYRKKILEYKKKEIELNKLLVKKENEIAQKELILLNKNSLIAESTKKINEVISKSEKETKNELNNIIKELKASEKSYNENEFEIILKENFSDFYKTLIEKYPSLTRNEIRLCLFAKLNLSVKEVSSITKQSSNSIITARHRLKKKLNLSKDESLTKFILKL